MKLKSLFIAVVLVLSCICSFSAFASDILPAPAGKDQAAPADGTVIPPVGAVIPRFDVKLVTDKIIPAEELKGWVVVYTFGNQENADTAIDWMKKLSLRHTGEKSIIFVCAADTTKFNSPVLAPFVKNILTEKYREKMVEVKRLLDEKNIAIDYKVEDRFVLVPDMKADIFRRFGLLDKRNKPYIFILDGNHRITGEFTEYNDELEKTFDDAVASIDKQTKFSYFSRRNKKGLLVKYLPNLIVLFFAFR